MSTSKYDDEFDSSESFFTPFSIGMSIGITVAAVFIAFCTTYGVKNVESELEPYSFIAQIDGGSQRCMTYDLPVNRQDVMINSSRGSYYMSYSIPGRWFGSRSTIIKYGVSDFIPVDSCP